MEEIKTAPTGLFLFEMKWGVEINRFKGAILLAFQEISL